MDFFRKESCICLLSVLFLFVASMSSLVACQKSTPLEPSMPTSALAWAPTSAPTAQTPSTPAYASDLGHIAVRFKHSWQMHQANGLIVTTTGVEQPLLLAVELIPRFTEERIVQKPAILEGTPIAGYFEEIAGCLVAYRLVPAANGAEFIFLETFFAPESYEPFSPLIGWKLRITIASQIVAYPVHNGMSLGEKYSITPQDVQAQQTWIVSEADRQSFVIPPTDDYLIVPDSTSGVFLYYPISTIVDSLTLTSGSDLNFEK